MTTYILLRTRRWCVLPLLLVLLLAPGIAFSCDVCGCANGGSYFGMMPQAHRAMAGVRYQYLHFDTHPTSQVLHTQETFRITELYGRFFPVKRVQVLAFLPYRFDEQITTSEVKQQQGFGDATVLASYNVLNTFMDSDESRRFNHTLLIGGGIKLPTGRFRYNAENPLEVANANFQPGTGSTDFIANAFYTITQDKWGLALNVSRKFNTTNSQGYRFGNQWYGTAELYRTFSLGNLSLVPHLGVYAEHSAHGSQDQKLLTETGGSLLNATAGATLFANHWMLGITAQRPLAQNLSGGHVVARSRALVQVAWLF
ncbi:transporter [Telluribacter sp. SYSU D00476]|uniref:transporter n=1 Tax=Telluribacter sp. SYSU D00476 TaxID=2811430 RepID=UPI001FF43EEC|nr:transporter [Telluribacter sp. SYSU D00476]